jgi:hypothetical protein
MILLIFLIFFLPWDNSKTAVYTYSFFNNTCSRFGDIFNYDLKIKKIKKIKKIIVKHYI